MASRNRSLALFAIASFNFLVWPVSAAPLFDGTKLTIQPGVGSAQGVPCSSGSCSGFEVQPGLVLWTDLAPGTEGGLIIGKDQASGGQETVAGGTPGELTAAAPLFLNTFGTFFTQPSVGAFGGAVTTGAELNIFDDASCSGAACNGATQLGSWHMAWNGTVVVPFGSEGGCLSIACSNDQNNGIFVSQWTVNPDNSYSLDYSQVSPDDDTSGLGGLTLFLHLEGIIESSNAPLIDAIWRRKNTNILSIFGDRFGTGNEPVDVFVNGVQIITFQRLDETAVLALIPASMTAPFTAKIVTATGMDSYPKPCPQ